MRSSERVAKHRQRQERAGRKLVTFYLDEDTIQILRERARPISQGEVVAQAVKALVNVGINSKAMEGG